MPMCMVKRSDRNCIVLNVMRCFRLNERLKEAARFRLSGDVLHDSGPAADDEDGAISNLRQQLTLASRVSLEAVDTLSIDGVAVV